MTAPGSSQAGRAGPRGETAKNRHIIEEFSSVGVPHRVAYDQWTQYQDWSKMFKKETAEVKTDRKSSSNGNEDEADNQLSVRAKIGPSERQWQAEIVGQQPGRRIEWQAKGGVQAKGVVTFHRLDDRLTHMQVVIHYVPSGFMETVGNLLRMPRRRVRHDLKLFKNFIELRGQPTGEGPGPIQGEGLRQEVDARMGDAEDSDGSSSENGSR